MESLAHREIPAALIRQFLPRLSETSGAFGARASPRNFVLAAIDSVLAEYSAACGMVDRLKLV
jgi:tagatose-1,6-bisphosphate aldolase non-catalytic subunit AgaZ/GatZ